jgi:4-carboxymuconolactone decarboxylase
MRLPNLSKEELNADQLALYNSIVSGPRSTGPQHFHLIDHTGALTGPFGTMLHSPVLGRPLQELGAAIRYQTSLTERMRELAILSVAADTDSSFERYAHERIGRAIGMTEQELSGLREGRFTSDEPKEAAAYELCEMLNRGQLPLSDDDFGRLSAILGNNVLLELVVLVGYYRTLSQLLHVFEVGPPHAT